MSTPTGILLVDDHQLLRQGLRALLEAEADLRVVAEAGDGRAAVVLAKEFGPQVVVMDISMPSLNGIDATRQILLAVPGVKVIALSAHADRRTVVEMRNAGASGYLVKDSAADELVRAIRSVMSGGFYFGGRVAGAAGVGDGGADLPRGVFAQLSPREREVLQSIAEGKATKQTARCLGVSVKTVETHRRNIMTKLDLDSVAELTKYAIREGLTSTD